jgi:hypothetical protein
MRTKLSAATSDRTALLHISRVPKTQLRVVFGTELFQRAFLLTIADLTPHFYYLWGTMEGAFNEDNPQIILEMKENIANFISNITPTELSRLQTR